MSYMIHVYIPVVCVIRYVAPLHCLPIKSWAAYIHWEERDC